MTIKTHLGIEYYVPDGLKEALSIAMNNVVYLLYDDSEAQATSIGEIKDHIQRGGEVGIEKER